jgi:hypothetical protein
VNFIRAARIRIRHDYSGSGLRIRQKVTDPTGSESTTLPDWLAHFYLMKNSARVMHYVGLHCMMLEFFKYSTHQPLFKEQLLIFPHFLEHSSAEKIAVCAHTTRVPNK